MSNSQTTPFDKACWDFTKACDRAMNWKENYFGAAYSTRITQAVHELERAIREMRDALMVDENV